MHTLIGHRAEISSAQFNWDCSLIATGSMDKTVKLWDTASGRHCIHYSLYHHVSHAVTVPCLDTAGLLAGKVSSLSKILSASICSQHRQHSC